MRFIPKLVMLAALVVAGFSFSSAVMGQSTTGNVAKVKAFVGKINGSRNTRISLEKTDGTKVKGRVIDARPDTFLVTTSQSGTTEIAYADVKKVSRPMSTQAKITLISGLAAAASIAAALLIVANGD